MRKKTAHCAPVQGTMGHWVGHKKYIETLLFRANKLITVIRVQWSGGPLCPGWPSWK